MPREREDRRRNDRDDEEVQERRSSGYRGHSRTVEGVLRHSKSSGAYDSIFVSGLTSFKPKEGENTIRILPPTWGGLNLDDDDFYAVEKEDPKKFAEWADEVKKWSDMWNISIRRHFKIGPDNGSYLCLKMIGGDCPPCEARQELDKEEGDEIKASEARVVWLIDRNNEKAGPQIWAMPKTKVFDEVVNRSIDKKTGALIHIDHPDDGYDVVFTREGTDDRTKYVGVDVLRDPSPIHDNLKIQDKWRAYTAAHPLPDCLNFYEASYIEGVLHGKRAPTRNKDEDEGDNRSSSRSSGSGHGSERDKEAGSARRRPLVEEDGTETEGRSERRRPSRAESDEDAEAEKDERDARPTPRGGRSSTPTTRRSDPEDDEEDARAARPRPRSSAKEDEDQGEGEEDLRSRPRSSRKANEEETADADDETDEPKTSRGARKEMSRLRERASK